MKTLILPIITLLTVGFSACNNSANSVSNTRFSDGKSVLANNTTTEPQNFNSYWFAGKAELSSYDLEINRYNEIRKGVGVFVFVTEDFSKAKQVKLDYADKAGSDKISVLKLNSFQRFTTGIYDYSNMSSLFAPIDGSRALKNDCSVQDWCGQVFTQMNLRNNKYRVAQFSYFETEVDKQFETEGVFLEDEIFTQIRLNPENLPKGKTRIIPNLIFSRMRHKELGPTDAIFEHMVNTQNSNFRTVQVQMPSLNRRIAVTYETAFPHKIERFEEFINDKPMLKAQRKKTVLDAYWEHNGNAYAHLRTELGL
jgi:hypothetical protein